MARRLYAKLDRAADPFDRVGSAPRDRVDDDPFFGDMAADIAFEVTCGVPGWPRSIRARAAGQLIAHCRAQGGGVTIEEQVHGVINASKAKYDNR